MVERGMALKGKEKGEGLKDTCRYAMIVMCRCQK